MGLTSAIISATKGCTVTDKSKRELLMPGRVGQNVLVEDILSLVICFLDWLERQTKKAVNRFRPFWLRG